MQPLFSGIQKDFPIDFDTANTFSLINQSEKHKQTNLRVFQIITCIF